jgi:hypothetical protein
MKENLVWVLTFSFFRRIFVPLDLCALLLGAAYLVVIAPGCAWLLYVAFDSDNSFEGRAYAIYWFISIASFRETAPFWSY